MYNNNKIEAIKPNYLQFNNLFLKTYLVPTLLSIFFLSQKKQELLSVYKLHLRV